MRRRGFLLGLLASTASVPLARAVGPQSWPVAEFFEFTPLEGMNQQIAQTVFYVDDTIPTCFAGFEHLKYGPMFTVEWPSATPASLWKVSWLKCPPFGNWRHTNIIRGP